MLAEFVGLLRLIVRPVVSHLEQVEVVFIAVLLHLVVKHFVGHEHIAPKLSGGSFVTLWHVENFANGWLKVGAPNSAGVDGHGHFDHDFVFVDASACLPGVVAKVGQER